MLGLVYLGGMKKYSGPTCHLSDGLHHRTILPPLCTATIHMSKTHGPPPFYFKNSEALQPGEEDSPALGFGARASCNDRTEAALAFLTGFALFFVSTDLFGCALLEHRTDGK